MNKKIGLFGFGILFGFALSRVGASEFDIIFRMFIGTDLTLAWVMITAILVGFLGMRVLQGQRRATRSGEALKVSRKNLGRWSLPGAALFGIGWGMAGACPGTVLAQLGEGKIFGFFTFAGMVLGTYLYALLKEKAPEL